MATLALINSELETLPLNLQEKVLAYIEFLKYKSIVKKVEKLTIELGGSQELMEGDDVFEFENSTMEKEATLQVLKDKTEFIGRLQDALIRTKSGETGVPHEAVKEKFKQWQNG
jgi:hypothetical protein